MSYELDVVEELDWVSADGSRNSKMFTDDRLLPLCILQGIANVRTKDPIPLGYHNVPDDINRKKSQHVLPAVVPGR